MTTAVTKTAQAASAVAANAQVMTDALIVAALRENGYYETETSTYNRIKVDGAMFTAGEETYYSNPKTGTPAFLARLLDVPEEYQGVWLTPELAAAINRPEDANIYCKSMFGVEGQDRKFSQNGHDCNVCPIGPFVKKESLPVGPWFPGTKCKWRGQISVQILDADGKIADDTVWLLDLPTTGMIEFKGISKEPIKGYFDGPNFTKKLADLGIASDTENPQRGFMRALTALRLGGIVAEVRSVPAKGGSEGQNKFNVIQLTPVQIVDVDAETVTKAINAGDNNFDNDDLPF